MKTLLSTLAAILIAATVSAQAITVTGKVTDESKNPLPGVTVVVKGTQTGVTTDANGVYSIKAEKGKNLVFAYIGYETKEIKVAGAVHNVTLSASIQCCEEVVVIGYNTVKSRTLTGSVSKISSTEMKSSAPVADMAYFRAPSPTHSPYDALRDEEYGKWKENRFFDPVQEPLSTFSIDVDAASYSNMRRYVNRGQLPPADAVRIEEMINYFSYDYPAPQGNDPVRITTEVGSCPWNKTNRLVRIGLKAREIATDDLPASNFVFLIDVSGSMYGPTRLELVKSSLKLLVNNLRNKDRVAIVVYAGAAGEVLPSTSGANKQLIREKLDALTAGGSTAGGAGINLAYSIARKNFVRGGNNRVILCTDGDFNVGISSPEGLEKLIEEQRASGVFLTVLGYGMGNYKDNRLKTLSSKGNGNYAYIDNLQEANKTLVQEFGGTMYTVAKDVKLQIEFNPAHVKAYRLVGYESRLLNKEDFNNDAIDAGEMGAGHTVTAFYEVVPAGSPWNPAPGVDPLKYQKQEPKPATVLYKNSSPEMLTVKLRYKAPDGDRSSKIERTLTDRGGDNVSADFRFAAAVAMFGQIMRDSEFAGDATFEDVAALAGRGLDNDAQGYRREFVRLAESARGLK